MIEILKRTSLLFMAAFVAHATMTAPVSAGASQRMRDACTTDYLKFCSQYDPDSFQTVNCMKRNERSISRECRKVVAEEGVPGGNTKKIAKNNR